MLVKIRSGISFYKVFCEHNTPSSRLNEFNHSDNTSFEQVTGPGTYQRIAGSIMGESFVESMMLQLTGYKNINEGFKEGFNKGNNASCDMTVEDIYGGGCVSLGKNKCE